MRILFSPVGKADPLTMLGDGPMLHLVRHFQPDKVILFLSPRMVQYDNKYGNYKRAIELLSNELGRAIPEIEYIYSEIEEAHKYDLYIDKFEEILAQLNEDESVTEIIVNLSSGTPAMGQALLVIHALGRLKLRALQVSTPAKDMNKEGDRLDQEDVDLETLWDLYKEDKHSGNPRWFDVESANLNDLLLRDNIRTLVEKCDYVGASQLAAQSKTISQEAKKLIDGCVARMNFDNSAAADAFSGTDFPYDQGQLLREQLWNLEVYLEREQWADYLRAMTPALFETYHEYIKNNLQLPDKAWLKSEKDKITGKAEYWLDPIKISENEDLKRIFDEIPFFDVNKHIRASSFYFSKLVEGLASNDESDSVEKLHALRELEEKARNPLAHSICRITKEKFENAAGDKSLQEYCSYFFELNKVEPGLYKSINDKIIELLYQ